MTGMKAIREPGPNERFTVSYWEAIRLLHSVYGGTVTPETAQTVALIYGRDFKTVAIDLERGMP